MQLEEKVRILENAPMDFLDSEISDSRGYTMVSNTSSNYRLELLLILAGVKPATDVVHSDLFYLPHSPLDWLSQSWQKIGNYDPHTNTFRYNDAWMPRIIEILKKLELPHETVTDTLEQIENFRYGNGTSGILPTRVIPSVIIAKDGDWLERMKHSSMSG